MVSMGESMFINKRIVILVLVLFGILVNFNTVNAIPVAYWPFNEGSGTITADTTGNGNTGTLSGGVSWTIDSTGGSALHFNGIDGYVPTNHAPSVDLTDQVKLEAWIKRESNADGTIISKNGPYYLGIINNKINGRVYAGNPPSWEIVSSTTDLQLNQWYHLIMTYDGSYIKVYVNGIEEGSAPKTGLMPVVSQIVTIGWGEPGVNFFFNGIIDGTKINNQAIVPLQESLMIKNATIPSPSSLLSCIENSNTNKIYCTGGWNGSAINQIFEYDPSTDSLILKSATLPLGGIGLHSCAENSLTHKIYCFGGYNGTFLDNIIEYNPITDSLIVMNAALPTPRRDLACAENSLTHKIYCFGGYNGTFLDNIIEYNPSLDILTIKNAALPSGRSEFSCAENSANNLIYCFGGWNGGSEFNQILEYNSTADTLIIKSAILPMPRRQFSCSENSVTHKIYCFGGWPPTDQIIEYIPLTDTLVIRNITLPAERFGLSCTENSNTHKMYCFSGSSQSSLYHNHIIEYTINLFNPTLFSIGDLVVNENETLTINLQAVDPNGDPLIFDTNAASILPSPFTFIQTSNTTALFEWTPTFSDQGNYQVTFNVTDGTYSDSETITITVNNIILQSLTTSGIPHLGNTIDFHILDTLSPNGIHILAFSTATSPGIVLPIGTVPLNPNPIFFLSLFFPNYVGLTNSQGYLNNGVATASWTVPNIPTLAYFQVYFAFVIVNPTNNEVVSISPALPIMMLP